MIWQRRRRRSTTWRLGTATVLLAIAVPMAPATGAGTTGALVQKDCTLDSVGLVPLIDLGTDRYQGAQGGLYPTGVDEMPEAHLALGLRRAEAITPRDPSGDPDPDGSIVLASIGMSNTFREFSFFERSIEGAPGRSPSLVLVNAAQGGQDLSAWIGGGDRAWEGLDSALADEGVTAAQVQAVWVLQTDRVSGGEVPPFPDTALTFRDEMTTLLTRLQDTLPNLQVAYLSSRIYGGYNRETSPSPEPLAYEEGFGVKWTIERQMNGDPALAADPNGSPEAPWLSWGPYLWADGTTARSDGLTWDCRDIRGDGVHPVRPGNRKVAGLLMDFFTTDPTTAWMWSDRTLPDPPADPAANPPPSTIAGDTPVTTTTATEPPTETTEADATTTTTEPPATTAGATGDTTTTTEPSPATTAVTTTLAADGADPGSSGPPAFLWVLVGAGLGLAIASTVAWARMRRPG